MDIMKNSKEMKLAFSECEHQGDLDNYIADIIKCGGKIIKSEVIADEEEGWILFEVENKNSFWLKFHEVDSFAFVY